jgi:hypothetical protein
MAFVIEGYPRWRANGLRELFCLCGRGDTFTRTRMLANGAASISVEGSCPKCGPVHITAGDWRRTHGPDRFVRVNPMDKASVEDADLAFGNPLTYNDSRARAYGRNRYSQGEGLHGNTTTRWNLFKDRAYYKRLNQARLDVLLTYCLMQGLAMEARRQKQAATPPPPTPLLACGKKPARCVRGLRQLAA